MQIKEVKISGKTYTLSGTLVTPSHFLKRTPAVVFYHGIVSQSKPRYVKRAEALAKKGIAALCFDFRGCGESEGMLGEVSIAEWSDDALLAFDFLAKQPSVDQKRIGISGKSFGGYMAALVSSKRRVKSMVLQAPAVYSDSWFKKPYIQTDEFKTRRLSYRLSKNALNNQAIRAIKQYTNPLLVIGSELDDICPRQIVEGYYEVCPAKSKKIAWIKGADHSLTNEVHNKVHTKMMIDWFTKTL